MVLETHILCVLKITHIYQLCVCVCARAGVRVHTPTHVSAMVPIGG